MNRAESPQKPSTLHIGEIMETKRTPKLAALALYIMNRWGTVFHQDREVLQVMSVKQVGETIQQLSRGIDLTKHFPETISGRPLCALIVALEVIYKADFDRNDDGLVSWGRTAGTVVFYRIKKIPGHGNYETLLPVLVPPEEIDQKAHEVHKKSYTHLSPHEQLELPLDAERFDLLAYIQELFNEAGVKR